MPVQYPQSAGKPYMPSNGTEGEMFMEQWCHGCVKEKSCTILMNSFAGVQSKAWRYNETGEPECTSFQDTRAPKKAYRCKQTRDIFQDSPND